MPITITMPALSPTMEEGGLTVWLKNVGDEVRAGDILCEIETDKATMEFEAVDEGTLAVILVEAGTEGVPVNMPIAILLEEGEDASVLNDYAAQAQVASAQVAPEPVGAAPAVVETEMVPVAAMLPPVAIETAVPDYPAGTAMVTQTMREALRDAMAEEMRRNDNVFLMGEEVAEYQGAYKVSQGLLDEFGARRVIDTPITEHGFTGIGIGAAFSGLNPIVEFMTFNFAMQAIDQIINSASKTLYMSGGQMGAPIVFRGANGAAARVGAQHSQCYASWYAHCPGLKVLSPSNPADAKGLLKAAIRDPNPVIFLENEILYGRSGEVPDLEDFVLPIGKARIARPGDDVTIVSFSIGVTWALEAAEALAAEGISAEVIDLRSLRPLDMDSVINSVMKTNRIVTVEEGWATCGIGSEISAQLMEQAFDYLDAPVMRIAGEDVPMPYAANLEKLALPDASKIVAAAKAVCYR